MKYKNTISFLQDTKAKTICLDETNKPGKKIDCAHDRKRQKATMINRSNK